MILHVLAVRDRAADVFGQPIFTPAVGLGVRSFTDEINNPQSAFSKHPEDYDLYVLGTYDDNTGALAAITPRMVSIGKDLVRK